MAKKFSEFTADTDALSEALEFVAYLLTNNIRVSVADLRKAMHPLMDRLGGQGYMLWSAEGQSWLKGAGTISQTTMTQNANVYVWQAQGTSPETYQWVAVDPTDTLLSYYGDQPFTGMPLGNTGHIMWYAADLMQKATNWPQYIVNTGYSNADTDKYDLIGSDGVAATQHATQLAAATADGDFPGASGAAPDFRFWALGWGSLSVAPGLFAEKCLAHKIDTEDDNALGWADPDSPLYVMGMPRSSQYEAGGATWLGAQLFAEIAGDNVHYVDISDHPNFDDVHQFGDGANWTGEDVFKQTTGLSQAAPADGKLIYERDTAALSEAFTKATYTAGSPTLSTGELNFDNDFTSSPITCSKIRLHYESDDGNNIPYRNFEIGDILRVADSSSPENYIEVVISDRAKWDALAPSTPNHAEWSVSAIHSSSGWPVADSTSVTVSLRKPTLTAGVSTAKNYYTGNAGKVTIPHSVQLETLDDDSFSEHMDTTYMTIAANRVPYSPLGGGAIAGCPIYHRRFQRQTTNGAAQTITNQPIPENTQMGFYGVATAYRSDGLTSSPQAFGTYMAIKCGATLRDTGFKMDSSLANIVETTTDTGSPHVSVSMSTLIGNFIILVTGQASQDWEWTIDLWTWDIEASP